MCENEGLITDTSRWFTNQSTGHRVTVSFDGGGFITNLVGLDGSNSVVRTQGRVWDARERLVRLVERDAQNNGFDWSAIYDGFNRRVQTTTPIVTNGTRLTNQPVTISQYYDPEVEFLVLGVSKNGLTIWKFMWLDLNGVYGGLNGLGGFEAVMPGVDQFCPIGENTT